MPRIKRRKGISFVAIERSSYHTPEWKALSAAEKILYPLVKSKYNGHNNGEISLPYTAMRDVVGCSSPRAIAAAFEGLIKKGWIKKTVAGGLYRKINMYELTFKFDKFDPGTINKSKYDRK